MQKAPLRRLFVALTGVFGEIGQHGMPYETEQRLKAYLDTNQLGRERLCVAVLSVDRRFSHVRPRHPHGGRDGGIDIDATFRSGQAAAGAVGFVVGANDSRQQKAAVRRKFEADARAAKNATSAPDVFVFFTNVDLTVSEEDGLRKEAARLGFAECDIFDRERLRVVLDSIDGFAARVQYLGIPLTDGEQATFFARWGDDIQAVIATGFQRVERALDRVLFLQEAEEVLSTLTVAYELDRTYNADEIGHFRAFCSLFLREPRLGIIGVFFGSADGSQRFYQDAQCPPPRSAGIRNGIGGGEWEWRYEDVRGERAAPGGDPGEVFVPGPDEEVNWVKAAHSSSRGMAEVAAIRTEYNHDFGFLRVGPRLRLRDFHGARLLHYLNASLARKLKAIHIYANGYKLDEHGSDRLSTFVAGPLSNRIPPEFSAEELADPWLAIHGQTLDFYAVTPRRLFSSREIPGAPPRRAASS